MTTQISELSNKISDLQNKVEVVIIKQNQFSPTYRKTEKLEEKNNNIYDTTEEIQETETKTFHKLGKVEMFFLTILMKIKLMQKIKNLKRM